MDMIQVNLLPREFRKRSGGMSFGKAGYYVVGAAAGIILTIAVITFYQFTQIGELDKKMEIARFRAEQLKKDIAVVDALIDVKSKIMQRMEAVDKLDQHRTVWVRVLEEVSQCIPEFVWLASFEETTDQAQAQAQPQKNSTTQNAPAPAAPTTASALAPTHPIKIQGFAFTLNALANMMIKMMRSPYFSEVEMASVEEVRFQEQKAYSYKLAATLHYLSEDELKNMLEQESGPDLVASY